jgi:CheY-like chemotaxis protein
MDILEKDILIVDDEKSWTRKLVTLLKGQGYRHVNVINNFEIFSELDGYDLIILDIRMPTYDGFQLKNYVKFSSPNTKVILISQHENYGLDILSKAENADGWLEKSNIDNCPLDLIMLIKRLLEENEVTQHKKQGQFNPGDLLLDIKNLHGIRTYDQYRTVDIIHDLIEIIESTNYENKKDILMDINQLYIELSKQEKDRSYIFKKIVNIEKNLRGLEKHNAIPKTISISEIIDHLHKVSKINIEEMKRDSIHCSDLKIPIKINQSISVSSNVENHSNTLPIDDINNLASLTAHLKSIIIKESSRQSEFSESIEKKLFDVADIRNIKNNDFEALTKLRNFIVSLGDEKSDLSKIIKGTEKGRDYLYQIINIFNKIVKYLPINSIKDFFI